MFLDIVQATMYEDPGRYLVQRNPTQETSSIEEAGTPAQQAFIQQQLLADGGQELFSRLFNQQLPPGVLENAASQPTVQPTIPVASQPIQ